MNTLSVVVPTFKVWAPLLNNTNMYFIMSETKYKYIHKHITARRLLIIHRFLRKRGLKAVCIRRVVKEQNDGKPGVFIVSLLICG